MHKKEMLEAFNDWIEGFGPDALFKVAISWDFSICVQTGKRAVKVPDKEQTQLTEDEIRMSLLRTARRNAVEKEKDIRQGSLRRS